MSGIAGIVFPDTFQISPIVPKMLETLKHRSAGIQDVVQVKNIQLGLCSEKFVSNERRSLIAGVDGNITNYKQVATYLKKKGAEFRQESFSELVLLGYEILGTEIFKRIDGDFAICIYDEVEDKLLLCRDRIGKKPLYWYQDQHHFIFATELKSLLASGLVPQSLAEDALSAYFTFGFIPQDMTPIKEVSKLLPAHYITLHSNLTKSIQSYWSYSSYFGESNLSDEMIVEKLDHLLSESVSSSLPDKTEPVASLLSGGLGSASVAYYLKKEGAGRALSAATSGFAGVHPEDLEAAKEVAATLDIPQSEKLITQDTLFDSLVPIIWHLDEPIADPNIVATYQLAKLTKQSANHAFSGMGSDEMLGGHERYLIKEKSTNLKEKLNRLLRPFLQNVAIPILKKMHMPWAYELIKHAKTNPWQFEFVLQNALFDKKQLYQLSPKLADRFDPEVFLHKFPTLFNFPSDFASYMYFDVKTRLPDNFMLQYERLTAANGLTWHTPYLDREILEFLASIMGGKNLKKNETAPFLKELLKDTFSNEFLQRPKVARPDFLLSWLDNPKIMEVFQLLEKGVLVDNGIISKQCLTEGLGGAKKCQEKFKCLWSLLVFEIWYRLFITKSITDTPPNISVKELLSQ